MKNFWNTPITLKTFTLYLLAWEAGQMIYRVLR